MIEPTLNTITNQGVNNLNWIEIFKVAGPIITGIVVGLLPLFLKVRNYRQEVRIEKEFEVLDELISLLAGYLVEVERYRNQVLFPTKTLIRDTGIVPLTEEVVSEMELVFIIKEAQLGKLKYRVYGYLSNPHLKKKLSESLDKLANKFVMCRVLVYEALTEILKVGFRDIANKVPVNKRKSSKTRNDLDKVMEECSVLLDEVVAVINKIKK